MDDNSVEAKPAEGQPKAELPESKNETEPQEQRSADPKQRREPKAWKHPQSWVPLEISFFFFIAPFLALPLLVVAGILYVYSQDTSGISFENLRDFRPPTVTHVYASDGSPIAELYREHRLVMPLEQIPPVVVQAFIAAEDSNFYNHRGVDLIGLIRAFAANLQAGRTVQGASTITQQMVRTFLLSNEKTYDRKLKEIVLSWRAERTFSKEEILHLYLNRIYLGRGAYGVESAARLYFGKGIQEVSLPEAALLAGLIKAPSLMAAHLGSEKSKERQLYVLSRMREEGYISPAQEAAARQAPLNFIKFRPNLYRETSPQFTEVVRRQAIDLLGKDELLTNGYRIHTTLDLKAQQLAVEALRNGLNALARRQRISPRVARLNQVQAVEHLRSQRELLENRPLLPGQESSALITEILLKPDEEGRPAGLIMAIGDEKAILPAEELSWFIDRRHLDRHFQVDDLVMVRTLNKDPVSGYWKLTSAPPPDIQGALVLMENKSGRVLAIVGGRDFGLSQFNRAVQARRQPGSSFKTFVYAAALDHGYTETSIIYDAPVSYDQGPGIPLWRPQNYNRKYSGPMTFYNALRQSINVVAVKICDAISPQVVAEYARKLGIRSPLNETLSLALGASEVTLLEMTQAYTAFPNLGSWSWPLFIDRVEDRQGNLVHEFKPYLTEALSPQTAYIMLDMLVGVANRGTAARVGAALKVPVGGKTGTTNSQADALFIGFTPEYTCGVWVGRDLRISLGSGEQGGRSAAPIFIEFMGKFLADKESGRFAVPPGVVREGLSDMSLENVMTMSGRAPIFKVGQEGEGRVDTTAAQASVGLTGERKLNFSTMSQDDLDRRLLDYLKKYEQKESGD